MNMLPTRQYMIDTGSIYVALQLNGLAQALAWVS